MCKIHQCSIPVFECLLPEPFNTVILNLLFKLATWHAFGKLRLHTEMTLNDFDNCTTRLGKVLHKFRRDVCAKFHTFDLLWESAARSRHRSTQVRKGKQRSGQNKDKSEDNTSKQQSFNMSTYKLHVLGDYVRSIWLFGTTDNYSTQVVGTVACLSGYEIKCYYQLIRENLNTNVSNGSMHKQTRSSSCKVLRGNSTGNDYSADYRILKHTVVLYLKKIPRTMMLELQMINL